MRNLTANALAQIASTHGNEPVTIIEIDWIEDDAAKSYADRTVGAIQGKILEVGDLDNVINVSDSDSSQEISITLDDTDGTIKAILDTNDIHKRSARVYQWFDGMDLADKFLLFAGKISSPIKWSERDRSVGFTIISQLEDKEIGFSAEEGEFPWIPKDLIDKAWPMIFGTVQDVPCLQFNYAVTGTTLCGVGIVAGKDFHNAVSFGGNDSAMWVQLAQMNAHLTHLDKVKSAYTSAGWRPYDPKIEEIRDQENKIREQITAMYNAQYKSRICAEWKRSLTVEDPTDEGCNPIRILGGEDFPQNQGLILHIGKGLFTGYFDGDEFYVSDRLYEEGEEKADDLYNDQATGSARWYQSEYPGLWNISMETFCAPSPPYSSWDFRTKTPKGRGNQQYVNEGTNDEWRTRGEAWGTAEDASVSQLANVAQHYWADAGSRVSIYSNEPLTYVASIIPGTVLAVKAYKRLEAERLLVNVPEDLYTVASVDYGPITAVQITVDKPLSTIADQGWEDKLYVTFESSVGPHTADILEYIIDNYTDLAYDSTSFTAIRTKLNPFPMNFPILEKKSTLDVLQEIAFQARCALWLSNGVFYIKYLPEEPSSDDTITVSDIDAENSVEVELTSTEDLVTKMIVEWRIDWSEDDPNKVILRHNVKKYGTQSEDFFFYCFNQPDIVLKVATFWLIRKANTWKKVRFKTYLQKLNLETFDTVTLDFGSSGYVSTSSVKAIIEEATYDSDSQLIDFVCETPVRSGEMVEYDFYWPSQLAVTETYPTAEERAAGYAGGDGIGSGATGQLPIGFTDLDDWGSGVIWVGGPNVVFSGPADYGENTPTDIGFVAQDVVLTSTYAELTNTVNPDPGLYVNYRGDMPIPPVDDGALGLEIIDLRKTLVIDSDDPDLEGAYLDTFFKGLNGDGDKLIVDCDESLWTNAESGEADGKPYHFRYDEDGEKFGAGTAWLKAD